MRVVFNFARKNQFFSLDWVELDLKSASFCAKYLDLFTSKMDVTRLPKLLICVVLGLGVLTLLSLFRMQDSQRMSPAFSSISEDELANLIQQRRPKPAAKSIEGNMDIYFLDASKMFQFSDVRWCSIESSALHYPNNLVKVVAFFHQVLI